MKFVNSAYTGAAATKLPGGLTLHSICSLNAKKNTIDGFEEAPCDEGLDRYPDFGIQRVGCNGDR